ncbi:MAG: tRNA (adenosine(37)-N6)-threonylcarbamoyltransferase complex dimerization subunit type 1 TsaB [Candidatus Dormibacteria bacterium]
MTVLAIDTTSRLRCVVVLCEEDGRLLDAGVSTVPVPGGALAAHLGRVLAGDPRAGGGRAVSPQAADTRGTPEIDAVVVAYGPGSYTGVRAGMAAGLGIAQAEDVPLHGIGSLEVIAHGAPPTLSTAIAVAAAGRGAVYAARFLRSVESVPGGLVPNPASPALRPGGLVTEPPRWLAAAAMTAAPDPVVSFDEIPIPRLVVLTDPAAALAAAVPAALARPALPRVGLSAHHVAVYEQSW